MLRGGHVAGGGCHANGTPGKCQPSLLPPPVIPSKCFWANLQSRRCCISFFTKLFAKGLSHCYNKRRLYTFQEGLNYSMATFKSGQTCSLIICVFIIEVVVLLAYSHHKNGQVSFGTGSSWSCLLSWSCKSFAEDKNNTWLKSILCENGTFTTSLKLQKKVSTLLLCMGEENNMFWFIVILPFCNILNPKITRVETYPWNNIKSLVLHLPPLEQTHQKRVCYIQCGAGRFANWETIKQNGDLNRLTTP